MTSGFPGPSEVEGSRKNHKSQITHDFWLGYAPWKEAILEVYLVDGTYELFRYDYALPSARDKDGREVGAVRGVIGSVLGMINSGTTHLGVATDHVIESFRNNLWRGYKTSAGARPDRAAPWVEEERRVDLAAEPGAVPQHLDQ